MNKPIIGFIGTGWIGGAYNENFIERGYKTIQYSLEPEFINNKEKLKDASIIFVAVPTPTTPEGFDDSILINAIKEATNPEQIIVIKSTIKIGTTDKIQGMFPDRYIIHSPEFLTEKTAKHDAANPDRNILGYTEKSKNKTGEVMRVLPCASFEIEIPCREAEFVKYMGNCWFYAKVLMMNIFYDIAKQNNLNFDLLIQVMGADKRVGKTHLEAEHQKGRGAGGHCFIKDFEALKEMYKGVNFGHDMLEYMTKYNNFLLKSTGKSLDILKDVFGKDNIEKKCCGSCNK